MLVKRDLASKDTGLWSFDIHTLLIASMKLSVDRSLCRDSLVKVTTTIYSALNKDERRF